MNCLYTKKELRELLTKQLSNFFFLDSHETSLIEKYVDHALVRYERCFKRVKNKYYQKNQTTYFNPLHGCQYSLFLYYLANSIFVKENARELCDKIYLLSKILSGADLYYEINLPNVVTFDHPLGAIMGRAEYSDFFSFSQGCTVGNNKGIYPTFGTSVFMLSNSKVIGDCVIGDNVIISAGTYIKDTSIPSNSLVFGEGPNLIIKENREDYVKAYAEKVFRYE